MPDRDQEVFHYETSKPNFMKWSAEVSADTDGKSLGNVRAMHGNVAAGVLTDIEFSDDERAIDVCAKIVDDNEWQKVLEGVYTGFSIGGRYLKKWPAAVNGKMVNFCFSSALNRRRRCTAKTSPSALGIDISLDMNRTP